MSSTVATGSVDNDAGVMTRDARCVDPHMGVGRAAQHIVAVSEPHLAAVPHDPVIDSAHSRLARVGFLDVADEPVPEPMHGPHEPRRIGRIAERATNLRDQTGEVRLEHERRGPQQLVQFGARHRPVPVANQGVEEIEGLGRQADLTTLARQLARRRVEGEVAESICHAISTSGGAAGQPGARPVDAAF